MLIYRFYILNIFLKLDFSLFFVPCRITWTVLLITEITRF